MQPDFGRDICGDLANAEAREWLVRKTLSFSKKRENHIGAIWYVVHHDNASLA
jgi:hypothetical protein